MPILSLSVSPIKPHYSDEWFQTVHSVIQTYSSRFICAEESGSNAVPTHVQAAVEIDDDRKEAFNRALIRAIHGLPGYGAKTKVLRKNPNAFKYVSKEDGRKLYVGFTDDDIVQLRTEYLQEVGQASGSNWPFYILARKVVCTALNQYQDGYELLSQPVTTVAATLLSDDLITSKEYNRIKNNSPVIRINMERMRRKWQDAVHAIRLEIQAAEIERNEAIFMQAQNAQKVEQSNKGTVFSTSTGVRKVLNVDVRPVARVDPVDPRRVEELVALRVAELDAEAIM